MENYSSVTGWQKLFSQTNPSNIRLPLQWLLLRYTAEIYRLINFDMLFQLLLSKFFKSELFLCLPKVDLVIN